VPAVPLLLAPMAAEVLPMAIEPLTAALEALPPPLEALPAALEALPPSLPPIPVSSPGTASQGMSVARQPATAALPPLPPSLQSLALPFHPLAAALHAPGVVPREMSSVLEASSLRNAERIGRPDLGRRRRCRQCGDQQTRRERGAEPCAADHRILPRPWPLVWTVK